MLSHGSMRRTAALIASDLHLAWYLYSQSSSTEVVMTTTSAPKKLIASFFFSKLLWPLCNKAVDDLNMIPLKLATSSLVNWLNSRS